MRALQFPHWFIPLIACLLSGCISTPDAADTAARATAQRAEFMLSFDDGPMPGATGPILDMLATLEASDGEPVKAGFFLLADAPASFWQRRNYFAPYELWTDKGSIAAHPDIARRIQRAGHTIGNHTTHHAWFRWPWLNTPAAVRAELSGWEAIAVPVLGEAPVKLFRPPYFVQTAALRETTDALGYQTVMGESVGDAEPNMTLAKVQRKTGAILAAWDKPWPCVLVFHDNRELTSLHLAEIVTYLQQQGFQLVHFDAARLQ